MAAGLVKTCALRSGSSGNAIFINGDQTRILVDAGVCCRTIEQSLEEIGETAGDLDAIVVTHEHCDHVSGVGVLMRRYKLPLYVNRATWQAMRLTIGTVDERLVRLIDTGKPFEIGNLSLKSFATPHDAAESVGYRIESSRGGVAVFTDIGELQEELLQTVAGCQAIYIEANYDHAMLLAGTYPAMLKKRISGRYGHLSNDDCATAVCRLLEQGTERFVLSHISKDNNYPELARLTVDSKLEITGARPGQDFLIGVAQRYAVSVPVNF